MADLVITAASVKTGANARKERGVAGVAITAGQMVYRDAATQKFLLADSNAAAVAAHEALGMALNGAALDQPMEVQFGGEVTPGAVLVPGTAYYLSDTPGGICPVADVGTGEAVCLLGLAKTAAVLVLDVQFPGVTL